MWCFFAIDELPEKWPHLRCLIAGSRPEVPYNTSTMSHLAANLSLPATSKAGARKVHQQANCRTGRYGRQGHARTARFAPVAAAWRPDPSTSDVPAGSPWQKHAAALLAGASLLLASAPVAPFPAPADAAGRSTIQFQQTVNARRLLREALPIDLSKSALAEIEDLLESIADTLPRSAGARGRRRMPRATAPACPGRAAQIGQALGTQPLFFSLPACR